MNEFLQWLAANPLLATIVILLLGILVTSAILIYLVAFLQGREVSFWPPKIGQKPDKSKKSVGLDTGDVPVPNASPIKDRKSEQGHDDYSVKVEGNVTGNVIGGSRNIVTTITQGVSKREFNRAQSNDYVERGRERVRVYAERITRDGEWDWNPLGHAIEYYVDAIRYDPQNQHAWINLAYVYHIIGDRKSALECMQRALELATPGPNYPGRHYKQVKAAIDGDCYLSGVPIDRPPISDWFRQKYEQFLPPR